MELESVIRNIVRDELAGISAVRPEPVLITPEQAAELCSVGKDTIFALVQGSPSNGFPCVRLSTRTIRIDKVRLAAWFAAGGVGGVLNV